MSCRVLLGAAAVALIGVPLAACGSSSSPPSLSAFASNTPTSNPSATTTTVAGSPTTAAPTTAPAAPTTVAATGDTLPTGTQSPGTWGVKPAVVIPPGPAPTSLVSTDLITGTGATATAGQSVNVQYVGVSETLKKQFDASWDRGQPFTFTLGAGSVIKGWDQGVVGMKVGGRRELIIPPDLGYGTSAPSPDIASNDTLIFIVDLVSIGSTTTTTG